MGLYFRNQTNSTIWLTYAYHYPNCEGDNWAKKGWYTILPGGTAKVWSGHAGGKKFFYFAEDNSGHTWSGQFFTHVPHNAFEWCWTTSSTSGKTVGFRKIDTISGEIRDYTRNLIL